MFDDDFSFDNNDLDEDYDVEQSYDPDIVNGVFSSEPVCDYQSWQNIDDNNDLLNSYCDPYSTNFSNQTGIDGSFTSQDSVNIDDPNFSNADINESVQAASDFFHIQNPSEIENGSEIGVYTKDTSSLSDDVLSFSKDEMLSMGLTEKDSLDLVMTHEDAHRVLQGMDTGYNSHQEELCCDYMAGVRAGLNHMDVSQFELSLGDTEPSVTHPSGDLRMESIHDGYEFAQSFMDEYGTAPTLQDCLNAFNADHVSQAAGSYGDFNVDAGEDSFKGLSSDDPAWNEKQAKTAFDNANYERKAAGDAQDRGDFSAAKDHLDRANSYDSTGKDYLEAAEQARKSKQAKMSNND